MNAHNLAKRKERLARAKGIRAQFKGLSLQKIADQLGITKQAVARILRK